MGGRQAIGLAAAASAVALGLLMAVTLVPAPRPQALMQLAPATFQLLCEGHFIDTATGIPEEPYSSPSHPKQMPGYAEPLPRSMREEIDARYTIDPEQYNYKGCLDATMVAETKRAIGQGRNEHQLLATIRAAQ